MQPSRKSKASASKEQPTLRARGLRLLARREHTRRELAQKLAPYVAEGDDLEALLDDFIASGWLSEARVVEQLVHAKRSRYGPARIRQVLVQRGVSQDAVAETVTRLRQGELEAARSIWARKFDAPRSAEERARQLRFLQARGFSFETAMRVVSGRDEP